MTDGALVANISKMMPFMAIIRVIAVTDTQTHIA